MMNQAQLTAKIVSVPRARYAPALQSIAAQAGELPFEWAALCEPGSGRSSTGDGLQMVAAVRDERIVGLGLGQLHAGRAASVYQPWLAAGEADSTAQALQATLDQNLIDAGARLLQVLLPERADFSAHFADCGYRHLTDLSYLVSLAESFPQQTPQGSVRFEPLKAADRRRMIALIDATYQGTLDCPALNGVRETSEVLEGYEQGGDARWFFFVCEGQQDVGCLLMADHARQDQCELVYMGIVPQARGRRLGLAITRFAQWHVGTLGRSRCLLAVDDANHVAVAHYQAAGFVRWTARRVWVKAIA